MANAIVYVLVEDGVTNLPIADPVFTPSSPFVVVGSEGNPPRLAVAGGASWMIGVQQGTTISVSAPGYAAVVVTTFGGPGVPFVGTDPQMPIRAILFAILFPIVVLGDSIQWGQGLNPGTVGGPASDKMAEIVGAELQANFLVPHPAAGFKVLRFAQSGATINTALNSASTSTVSVTAVTAFPGGEVPAGLLPPPVPTILDQAAGAQQVQGADNQTSSFDSIQLVLLDGGINDVGLFTNILNPFVDQATLLARTNAACGGTLNVPGASALAPMNATTGQMSNLLTAVGKAFPNAVVVVTGYYQILSEFSDVSGLVLAVGILTGSVLPELLGPAGWLASVLVGDIAAADVASSVIAKCAAFKAFSDASLASAVDLANTASNGSFSAQVKGVTMTAPRFIFVPAPFLPVNALFTGGSDGADEATNTAPAFLWGFDPALGEISNILDTDVGTGSILGGILGGVLFGPFGAIFGSTAGGLEGADIAITTILGELSPVDEVSAQRLGPEGACAVSGNAGAVGCDLASVGHPNIEGEAAYARAVFDRLFFMFGTTLPNMGLVTNNDTR